MKAKPIAIAVLLLLPFLASAQIKGLLNKVKSKVEERVNNKTDKAMDKTLDEIQGKKTNEVADKDSPVSTAPEVKTESTSLKSYSKYDFVPADSIIYARDFAGENMGELAANWNTTGTAEVTTLNQYGGNWLRLHSPFTYISDNNHDFGDNYTVEFDVILQLKNNGWMYPQICFGFFSIPAAATENELLKEKWKADAAVQVTVSPAEFKGSKILFDSYWDNKYYFRGDAKPFGQMEQWYGKPIHVAVQVQKERFRMWMNEEKVYDLPKAVPLNKIMNQLRFEVKFTNYNDEQYGIYLGNLKVARGFPDTRNKLAEAGKFSTTGILFDVNADKIKPISYGTVKEVAEVLQKFPALKIKVVGHTDSDGNDAANLELSKKRAAAVKQMLVSEFGIEDSRIETDGKGETEPVADNQTKEGKMQNRRVEFIKL
jgi:outer membrane protein OmpA-like peptidoglycan-associated protein